MIFQTVILATTIATTTMDRELDFFRKFSEINTDYRIFSLDQGHLLVGHVCSWYV